MAGPGLGFFDQRNCAEFAPRIFAEQDLYQISRLIGDETPQAQDALVNFLQIYRDEGIANPRSVQKSFAKTTYNTFCDVDFGKIQPVRLETSRHLAAFRRDGRICVYVPAVSGATNQAFLKILHPTQSFELAFFPVTLKSISGEQAGAQNDPVTLEGEFTGVMPSRWLVLVPRR